MLAQRLPCPHRPYLARRGWAGRVAAMARRRQIDGPIPPNPDAVCAVATAGHIRGRQADNLLSRAAVGTMPKGSITRRCREGEDHVLAGRSRPINQCKGKERNKKWKQDFK